MTAEEHRMELRKLMALEGKLMRKIASLCDDDLMDTYSEWTNQRRKCNEGLLSIVGNKLE